MSEYNKRLIAYQESVMDYLEYLGYPDYVVTYEPPDVAQSISSCCIHFFKYGVSYRFCALCVFALTLDKINTQEVKH